MRAKTRGKVLDLSIALLGCVPLAPQVHYASLGKGTCHFTVMSMAKSTQDGWKMKASTFWKLHFLSLGKRAAFWKAALRYECSDATPIAGKNKVDAHFLGREAALEEREKP